MATAQLTRDVITLKGSAAIASEFLCYSGTRSNGFNVSIFLLQSQLSMDLVHCFVSILPVFI